MPANLSVVLSGAERSVPDGTTAAELLDDKSVVVARVGGELKDQAYVLRDGDTVEGVTADSPDGLAVLRHSCAHVLAQAVQDLFPGTQLGIGPPIVDGFYYDFAPERPFTPEDLAAIEKRMSDIMRQRQHFARRVVTEDEARSELAGERF